MKKLLLALPFVATASWAGTTLYTGNQTRAAYDELVAQLDRSTTFAVSRESYTAGFAASHAVTKVSLSDAPDAEVLFRLNHEIAHTPVGIADGEARVGAARIVTTLVTDGMSAEILDVIASFEGGEPFALESDVGFGGEVAHAFRVARFEHDGPNGGSLRFEGAEYDVRADAAGRLSGSGTIGEAALELPAQGARVAMAPGADRFDYDWVQKGVFTGEQRLALGTISIESPAGPIALEGVTIESASDKDGDRLDSEARFAIGRIEAPMPLPLDSASLGVKVGGVDLAGLDTFLDGIDAFMAFDVENAAPEALFDEIGALYGALIRPGLSLDYDVAFANGGGDVSASAGVLFEGDGSATGHDSMTTVGELVRALKLTATLDADAGAVAMTPAAMFLMGDQLAPWIVSDANGYRSDIVVDDLIVDVNGEPLSLEMMVGDMLALPLDLSMLSGMAPATR